jgi:3-methyladenine DNA glycosylase AlkC
MPDRLKDLYFTRSSLEAMAAAVRRAYPAFDAERFLALVFDETWDALELKDRMRHTTRCLGQTLPPAYPRALDVLRRVAPELRGFDAMVLPDFVEQFGQADWERSLPALAFFTRFASGEFAIRPFLQQDPERVLPCLHAWAQDPDPHVRRLASEGSRPRLPWAMALPAFKADPRPLLPVLERLKDDPDEMVRRSVANHLNDISKDHPGVVLDLAEAWHGQSENTDRLLKHALRGLLKQGNRRAMRLFGFGAAGRLRVAGLRLPRRQLKVGDDLVFEFDLVVDGQGERPVRLEYAIGYVKARGELSRKVFKLSERVYAPGTYPVRRKHSLADRSTRTHHAGTHTLTIIANGQEQASAAFALRR